MPTKINIFGQRYDDAVPCFLSAGDDWFNRVDSITYDGAGLDAYAASLGYTFPAYERGDAPADYGDDYIWPAEDASGGGGSSGGGGAQISIGQLSDIVTSYDKTPPVNMGESLTLIADDFVTTQKTYPVVNIQLQAGAHKLKAYLAPMPAGTTRDDMFSKIPDLYFTGLVTYSNGSLTYNSRSIEKPQSFTISDGLVDVTDITVTKTASGADDTAEMTVSDNYASEAQTWDISIKTSGMSQAEAGVVDVAIDDAPDDIVKKIVAAMSAYSANVTLPSEVNVIKFTPASGESIDTLTITKR